MITKPARHLHPFSISNRGGGALGKSSIIIIPTVAMIITTIIIIMIIITCLWNPGLGPAPALYFRVGVEELITPP